MSQDIDGASKIQELGNQAEKALRDSQISPSGLQRIIEKGRDWQRKIQAIAFFLSGESVSEELPESQKDRRWLNCQTINLLWRWGLVSALFFAIFWSIWSLFGPVPEIEKILWMKRSGNEPDIFVHLPFALTRWGDIFFAPLWSSFVILAVRKITAAKGEDVISGLVLGLILGLVLGLILGLILGLNVGLGLGLIVGLGIGLFFGLFLGLGVGLDYGLGFVDFDLSFGLGFGLGLGLIAGLFLGLGFGLVFGLIAGLKFLFSSDNWSRAFVWLSGR